MKAPKSVIVVAGIGLILLAGAFLFPETGGRTGTLVGLCLNLGAALILFAPLAWISKKFDEAENRHENDIESTRSETQKLREDLDDRLTTLEARDRQARDLQSKDSDQERSKFDAVLDAEASGSTVWKALAAAEKNKLISTVGVRVPYSEHSNLVLDFSRMQINQSGAQRVRVRLREAPKTESPASNIMLEKDQTIDAFLINVRRAAQKRGETGEASPVFILGALAETLNFAYTHAVARPIIQHFPPQWALTERALVAPEHGQSILHDRPDRHRRMSEIQSEKSWLDHDSFGAAWEAAYSRFPLSDRQAAVSWRG